MIEIFPQKDMEPVEVYIHEGEEFIYVLEGVLTYYYNGKVLDLYPGDAFHIRSDVPHNLANTINKIIRILAVSIPNKFEKT